MEYKYKLGVFIGRFQPLHNAHLATIKTALALCERVLILVGSAHQPRTPKNPFTAYERRILIQAAVNDELGYLAGSRLEIESLNDNLYDDTAWATDVRTLVNKYCVSASDTALFGSQKDESSYYFDLFPTYQKQLNVITEQIDSTHIRNLYFQAVPKFAFIKHVVPSVVYKFLSNFSLKTDFEYLIQEVEFINNYKKQWEVAPYPVTFLTTDAVVVQSGHVLLIKRKASPGKGLYALPGGFLDANSDRSLEDCAIRELKEETKIALPDRVIRGSIKSTKVFDAINRSSRGRTVTHAFYIKLEDTGTLPKVKGSDDAETAQWIDIAKLTPNVMYEDHYSIIKYFV